MVERFLREVSRKALPNLVRTSESVESIHQGHAEVLENASEIALRILRPDMFMAPASAVTTQEDHKNSQSYAGRQDNTERVTSEINAHSRAPE